jgi:hypothetical protein
MSRNDITGDVLRSRELSPEGKENWDRIFAPKVIAAPVVWISTPAICPN